MRIITAGRTDTDAFFKLSGIRNSGKLKHHPFLVFVDSGRKDDSMVVAIVNDIKELLELPDDVQVMAQWRGEYRSDFFQFTVGDLRKFIAENPPDKWEVV